jgi:hypothetical protein
MRLALRPDINAARTSLPVGVELTNRRRGDMRNKRLDILRCVAVLLVIGHHSNAFPILTKSGMGRSGFIFRAQWVLDIRAFVRRVQRATDHWRWALPNPSWIENLPCILCLIAWNDHRAAPSFQGSSPSPTILI